MKQGSFTVESNRFLTPGVFDMTLRGDTSAIAAPGQFVNLKLEGFFLRRPISVCDWEPGRLRLICKVQGRGTEALSAYAEGTSLDLLTGLGNGYDLERSGKKPLLIGGGVGAPPLYGLAKRLRAAGAHPSALLGFRTAEDIFLAEEFEALGIPVILATEDGSAGIKGRVTDAMGRLPDRDYLFACGPEPMLKAVYDRWGQGGQLSFEERMGCGFGACMGCSRRTKGGCKRICRDGPVLDCDEIVWEEA